MPIFDQARRQNGLLARLSHKDLEPLEYHFEIIDLSLATVLAGPVVGVDHAYFPLSGLVSVLAKTHSKTFTEVGMYGREGAGPSPLFLGQDRTADLHLVQAAGQALRISRSTFNEAAARSVTLRDLMIRYIDVFMIQVGQTALSRRDPDIRKRLARWILMIDDRVDDHRLDPSPAALAAVLGFSLAEVTTTILAFSREGLVRDTPSGLILLDRDGLDAVAGPNYGLPEAEYHRLLGPVGFPHRQGISVGSRREPTRDS